MSALLIHTKLCTPAVRRTQVLRPHLLAQLQALDEPGMKLAVVVAPPGFGKTSLLAEWAAQTTMAIAWLTVDEGENDPIRFWDYVLAAIQRLHPSLGERVLALLHEPAPLPMTTILGYLLNELSALPAPLALVLDDYHLIQAEPVYQAVTFLLDHLPAQMRLVIAARIEPPLPLARLRVRGEMVELRAADLRFSTEEAAAFLGAAPNLHLAEHELAALVKRTEGWAAGLQVAALALQGREDTSALVNSFAGDHRFLLDYLADEVLARQSHAVQCFLLETSLLSRLSAPLCEWLTGQTGGQAMLEALERENLFLVPLDERRQWYRYHPLFADFLRYRLQQQAPQHVPELHRRASGWFEQHGFLLEAVSHALAAQDFDQAANLIADAAEMLLWRRPELHTLQRWLAVLPEDALAARPRLSLYYAWTLYLTNQLPAAEQQVQQAERALAAAPGDGVAQGMVAAVRSTLSGIRRDFASAHHYARQALTRLPEGAISWRCMAAINLGVACAAAGEMQEASEQLSYAMELSQEIGSSFAMLSAFWHLASLQIAQLRLRAAEETCRQLLRLVQEPDLLPFPVEGYIDLLLGEIYLEWNRVAEAERHLLESAAKINPEGFAMALLRAYVALARTRRLAQDGDGANAYLAKAEDLVVAHHLQGRSTPLDLLQAQRWLEQGNLAAMARWIEEQRLTLDGPFSPYRESYFLMLARALLAKARLEPSGPDRAQALTLLRQLLDAAEAGGRTGTLVRGLTLLALALALDGRREAAVESLARALVLAEPEGCIRLFVDEGPPVASLLSAVLDASINGTLPAPLTPSRDYVRTLLASLGVHAPASIYKATDQPLVEMLSERELEVLRLLADDLSSNEIAERLVIAVETARKHIKNIYGKLGAHGRPEALRRSRELGLL